MGAYVNRTVLGYFMYTAKSQIEGRAAYVRCAKNHPRVGKLDLDAYHRALRLMAKLGYLNAREDGDYMCYTIVPKGIALYDTLMISLKRL